MAFRSIYIPENYNNTGLSQIHMSNLQNLVIVAGPNGAGKSRLFGVLRNFIGYLFDPSEQLKSYNRRLQTDAAHLEQESNSEAKQTLKDRIKHIKDHIKILEGCKGTPFNQTIDFVPKNLNLTDPQSQSKSNLVGFAQQATQSAGMSHMANSSFAKIQHTQDLFWEATHPNSKTQDETKQQHIQAYEDLRKYVFNFLKTDIERDENGNATLFGKSLGATNLSDGQKILLQFCVAIHYQSTHLNKSLILMDEPETHLHPDVLIHTIETLVRFAPTAQIWISTHSVHIISHFQKASLWYANKGSITYSGRNPEQVLHGLLGNESRIQRLLSFVSLPTKHAMINYAHECLLPPTTSSETKDDQSKQITQRISQLKKIDRPLRILDYGCGQGRLLNAIFESSQMAPEEFKQHYDYFGFDTFQDDKDQCQKSIQTAYGDDQDRYFNEASKLQIRLDRKSVDVIILCNVFHEIDPKAWITIFNSGLLNELIKEEGVLLIVEDHLMPVGEKAHSHGFLVFDTLQFKKLFAIKESDEQILVDDIRKDGRLKAHTISAKYLNRVTSETRKESIHSLLLEAKEQTKKVRSNENTYKNGLAHAFWCQQFTNASLAFDEL